ncbi:MAG: LegC family aminotransferase [Candidatus Electryonea clarkiae]|nr:LegC family aminotransferase [Candidatus Electryonea clarkiae]MDP8285063.1 LegC family aminotransferase [Candidatus Electryonea clarkiae]
MIPLSVPSISGNEWRYIKECLDTEWVSSAGKYVDLFEEKITDYTESKYAIACANGTSALQVSLRLVGVKRNCEVIVPTITFIAPINVVRYLGAEPLFMDADDYYNIDIEKTIDFIKNETKFENGYTLNKHTLRHINAIIPVNVFGNAVNLEPLLDICRERNIKIVEDATESLGTRYNYGQLTGKHCGTIGELGCLSFNGNKMITTGGGGMILTDDKSLAERAKYLTTQAKDDPIRYIHNDVGYNFRMTNIQAAMGVAQLEQLPGFLEKKRNNYQIYRERIDEIPGLRIADVPDYADNNCWMVAMQVDKEIYSKDREQMMKYLADNKIESRPVWYLNHSQKPYEDCMTYKIEKADILLNQTLNIPNSVNITKEEVNTVIGVLANA